MPPKPKKRTVKASAPPTDPLKTQIHLTAKEARRATEKLEEMDEDEAGVEEATEKAADAQYAFVKKTMDWVARDNLPRPTYKPYERRVQVELLAVLEAVQQCRKVETDLVNSLYTRLMQMAANRLVEAGTKELGHQLAGPWIPTFKDDEAGQNHRNYVRSHCFEVLC
jgi:hypothetical protein